MAGRESDTETSRTSCLRAPLISDNTADKRPSLRARRLGFLKSVHILPASRRDSAATLQRPFCGGPGLGLPVSSQSLHGSHLLSPRACTGQKGSVSWPPRAQAWQRGGCRINHWQAPRTAESSRGLGPSRRDLLRALPFPPAPGHG